MSTASKKKRDKRPNGYAVDIMERFDAWYLEQPRSKLGPPTTEDMIEFLDTINYDLPSDAKMRHMVRGKQVTDICNSLLKATDENGESLARGTFRAYTDSNGNPVYARPRLSRATLQEVAQCLDYMHSKVTEPFNATAHQHVLCVEWFGRESLDSLMDHKCSLYVLPNGKARKLSR